MAARHTDPRRAQLEQWLAKHLDTPPTAIRVASADASFRRYFRVWADGGTLIAMDAPPDKEDSHPFVEIAAMMGAMGLNVPHVHAADFEQGYFLLSDLGDEQYLRHLNEHTVERLYGDALEALLRLQVWGRDYQDRLPGYDRPLLSREMDLFDDWYLQRHLGYTLTAAQQDVIANLQADLIDNALEQPKVFVHRDYHSRNLMWQRERPQNNPGILDFQDAVRGPLTYDLVSLLKDCYIAWPRQQVRQWVEAYHRELIASGILEQTGFETFLRWFDLMGVQRQLKASGIFARLNLRDHKPGYLKDIPRTLNYIFAIAEAYPVLQPFAAMMDELGVRELIEQPERAP